MTVVLDASAILAWLQDEPGAGVVDELIDAGVVSAVNWSEVLQKIRQHGRDDAETGALLEAMGVSITEATQADATLAAALWDRERPLSLADRFCLALARRLGVPAVTAERAWADIAQPAEVTLIR